MDLKKFADNLKIFFRELWKSLKILLTYGEVRIEDKGESSGSFRRSVRREHAGKQLIEDAKFNGLMTSLEMFVLLMTFIIILFIAPIVNNDIVQNSTKMTLIVLMTSGFVVMAIFVSCGDAILQENRKKTLGLRGQLVLIGITIFFVLGSFLDLSNMVFLLRCFPVYLYQCDSKTFFQNLVALVFHFERVLYLAAQTAFCTSYRVFRFKDRCLTRYGLMMLHVSNLAIWFDVLLRQTCSKLKLPSQPSYYNQCKAATDNETESNHFIGCVFLNGTYSGNIRSYGNDLIYPFLFQFSLLVLECYVHWFVRCGRPKTQPPLPPQQPRLSSYVGVTKASIKTSSYCVSEEQPAEVETSVVADATGKRNHTPLTKKYVVVIVFMNILFVFLYFLPLLVEETDKKSFVVVSSIYCTFYWTVNILLTFLGYYCTTAFKENPKKKRFKSLNYLLILSAIGPYVYVVTSLEVIAFTDAWVGEPRLLIAFKEAMFFLSVFSQIPFCFLAGRVVLPSKSHEDKFRVNCFKAITLHLAASNCVLWIVNSFSGAFNIPDIWPVQTNYFKPGSWQFVDNIIQPLSVFFRFNSFLLFTAAHIRMSPFCHNRVAHAQ